jgi:hypothetical protein
VVDASAAIAELKLRAFDCAIGHGEARGYHLSLEPEFVHECFGEATLRVNGNEVEWQTGLILLRQSVLTLDETPALGELISLLRLERFVPRDVSELREVARKVGLEWAIDFGAPPSDPEFAHLFELAVASEDSLKALAETASFQAGDWLSVIDVIFRFSRA